MDPFVKEDNSFLSIEKWKKMNKSLVAGFTTRNGGVSEQPYHSLNLGLHVADNAEHVVKNRQLLAEKLGFPLESWVLGEQVHDVSVQEVTETDRGKGAKELTSALPGIDGLYTTEKNILCAAFYADCVPLFFYDPATDRIGIAHAGWKGTVGGMSIAMVEEFIKAGSKLEDIHVGVGPSISGDVYEVDERVADSVKKEYRRNCLQQKENGRYFLDLKQLNIDILLQSGVVHHNIEVTDFCTMKDEALFFSHRRDNGKTGRMLGFIGLKQMEE